MKHNQAMSPEQVVIKLKRAAARWVKPEYSMNAKQPTYRNIAGPYKVKAGEFESKRFYFNPQTLQATSYGWWSMLAVHNGKLVHNDCGYSPQTSVHQSMLSAAMKILGIKPDLVIDTRANIGSRDDIRNEYLEQWAKASIDSKYAREPRTYWLKRLTREMKRIEKAKIGVRFSKKAMKAALQKAEERRAQSLKWKRERALTMKNILEVAAGLSVHFHSTEIYGTIGGTGVHCIPSQIYDVERSALRARQEGHEVLHVYLKRAPKSVHVAKVAARPMLQLVREG